MNFWPTLLDCLHKQLERFVIETMTYHGSSTNTYRKKQNCCSSKVDSSRFVSLDTALETFWK